MRAYGPLSSEAAQRLDATAQCVRGIRRHISRAPRSAPDSGSADISAAQSDLQILRDWQAADQGPVVTRT